MINEPGNRRIILELIVLERFERSGIRYGGKVARIRLVRRAKPEVRRGKGFECLVVKRTTTVMQDVLLVRRSKTELRLRSVHFLLDEESCMICLGGERASELGIGDEKGRDGASYIEFFAKGRDNETRRDRFSYALGLRGVTRGGTWSYRRRALVLDRTIQSAKRVGWWWLGVIMLVLCTVVSDIATPIDRRLILSIGHAA